MHVHKESKVGYIQITDWSLELDQQSHQLCSLPLLCIQEHYLVAYCTVQNCGRTVAYYRLLRLMKATSSRKGLRFSNFELTDLMFSMVGIHQCTQ